MDQATELSELKAEVARAHERLAAAVEGFDPIVLENEPAVGSWSPRDVAGHLTDWEGEMLAAAEHILGGPKPRHHPIKHGQSYNTMHAALRGADPWRITESDLNAAHERTRAFLDRLAPDQLRAIGPYPWGEVGTLAGLIGHLVSHLDEHTAQIEEWRLSRTGVKPS